MTYHYTDLDDKPPMVVPDDKATIAQLREELRCAEQRNGELQRDLDYAEAQIDQLIWELNMAMS